MFAPVPCLNTTAVSTLHHYSTDSFNYPTPAPPQYFPDPYDLSHMMTMLPDPHYYPNSMTPPSTLYAYSTGSYSTPVHHSQYQYNCSPYSFPISTFNPDDEAVRKILHAHFFLRENPSTEQEASKECTTNYLESKAWIEAWSERHYDDRHVAEKMLYNGKVPKTAEPVDRVAKWLVSNDFVSAEKDEEVESFDEKEAGKKFCQLRFCQ